MDSPKVADSTAPSARERRKKRVRVYNRRVTLKWLLAVLVFSATISLLLISLQGLFSSLLTYDTAYRPVDIERRYHELKKMKDAVDKEPPFAREGR